MDMQQSKALHLFCGQCVDLAPHHAIRPVDVDDPESLELLRFLKRMGHYDDTPVSDYPNRTTFIRGRQCQICGDKTLTAELGASILVSLLQDRQLLHNQEPVLKEIYKLRRGTSALLKKLKGG